MGRLYDREVVVRVIAVHDVAFAPRSVTGCDGAQLRTNRLADFCRYARDKGSLRRHVNGVC